MAICQRSILTDRFLLVYDAIYQPNRGYPAIEDKLFFLDCKLAISEIEQLYPELYAYLQEGIKSGVADRYLCKSRKLWYAQENRAESYFYGTYMGRIDKNGEKSRQ